MNNFQPTKEQHKRAVKVDHMTERLGNMWILPKHIDQDKETYHYHGCADLFLQSLYATMTGKGKVNLDLKGLLYQARKQMAGYQGSDGFLKLTEGLMLNDYVDYYGKPTDVLPHVWSMMKGLTKESYFKAVDAYCSFVERFIPKREKKIIEKLKVVLSGENKVQENYIANILEEEGVNEYVKVGRKYFHLLPRLVEIKEENKRELFDILNLMNIEDGFGLGLKLAGNVGMGDESWFFTYDKKVGVKEFLDKYGGLTGWMDKGNPFDHIMVERSAKGAWQAYLFSIATTQLPLFWHGGYCRRTYILTHDDLKDITEITSHGEAPLYGIKQDLTPKVKMYNGTATVVCCYWTEWGGLIRETTEIKFDGNCSVVGIREKKKEVLYEYDCGICF